MREYLLGLDKRPKYLFGRGDVKKYSEAIADHWLKRWVSREIMLNDEC